MIIINRMFSFGRKFSWEFSTKNGFCCTNKSLLNLNTWLKFWAIFVEFRFTLQMNKFFWKFSGLLLVYKSWNSSMCYHERIFECTSECKNSPLLWCFEAQKTRKICQLWTACQFMTYYLCVVRQKSIRYDHVA